MMQTTKMAIASSLSLSSTLEADVGDSSNSPQSNVCVHVCTHTCMYVCACMHAHAKFCFDVQYQ